MRTSLKREMTDDERRMTKEARSRKPEGVAAGATVSSFGFLASFVIWDSSFVTRGSAQRRRDDLLLRGFLTCELRHEAAGAHDEDAVGQAEDFLEVG